MSVARLSAIQTARLIQSVNTHAEVSLYTHARAHITQITTGAETCAALRPSAAPTHGRSVAVITFITFNTPTQR